MANNEQKALARVKRSQDRYRFVTYIITVVFFVALAGTAWYVIHQATENINDKFDQFTKSQDERDLQMKRFICSLLIRQAQSDQSVEDCVKENTVPTISRSAVGVSGSDFNPPDEELAINPSKPQSAPPQPTPSPSKPPSTPPGLSENPPPNPTPEQRLQELIDQLDKTTGCVNSFKPLGCLLGG